MVESKLINKDLTSVAVFLLYLAGKQDLLVGIDVCVLFRP